jgi:formylglycine-generating enzyme required for sulfatase activity
MWREARDAAPNERPVALVTVSRFYLSRHPITNAQYERFDPNHVRKRTAGAGDEHPVVYVSSDEAMTFCQWLSTREKRRFRLPTEAEWEYAARSNDGRKYPWGNHDGRGDLGNFADRNTGFAWSDRKIDDGFAESSPIGSFPHGASPFGMEDMAGNVWEWCLDFMEPYKAKPRVNPRGPNSGMKRVYRGGSWKSRFNSLRATTRRANVPSFSCNDLGFRIVCECE